MAGFTKLGKYLIRRELGKGAMGVVYEGFDPIIERTVAIKTILPAQLSTEEAASVLARFKREAQAAGRLNHPNIVAIYDYGEVVAEDDRTMVAAPAGAPADSGQRVAYIAMEFVKGRELRDFFEANERFPLKEVDRIMGEMLGALAHAHANGVVHRDMKPANLIVLADGTVKVADFGIARVEKSELTQAGTVMGTPSYMSPEQFMGQTVDGRSDIFSCGVILYQFLTGEKPFTGNTTTIMYKVLREEPLAPSMLNVALPPAFDAVVKKAMAKNPDERYQTAQEFAAAIKAAVAGQNNDATVITPVAAASDATVLNTVARPPVAAPMAPPAPVQAAVSMAAPPAPPVPPPGPLPSSNKASKPLSPAVLALGGLVALAVLGGGGYVMMNKDKGAAPAAQSAGAAPQVAAAPTAAAPPPAPAESAQEAGTITISALGLADPKDPKFKGDAAAAQEEARADAKRQLVEKAAALYVDKGSLDKNYAVLEQKLFSQSGSFIKTVVQEGAAAAGKDGLMEAETRAVVKVREVQKSLNQLSKEERISFIRNNGDPKVAIQMSIRNAESQLPQSRSAVAENVVKERIKSFGFRVWSNEGDAQTGPNAKVADFQILGEVSVVTKSMMISGMPFSKTALTAWTVKAIDKATGEEIYLNTVMPNGKSWNTEELALADIGKLMGDEFSKNFFLEHFNFGTQKINLNISGLPDAEAGKLLLRELRGVRQVLDAQLTGDGKFQLQLAEGSASDIVQDNVLKPLNTKLGQACFALAGATAGDVNATFSAACAQAAVRAKLETGAPAGLLNSPNARGKALLKASGAST
jgi:serine/threonine-protein kinase